MAVFRIGPSTHSLAMAGMLTVSLALWATAGAPQAQSAPPAAGPSTAVLAGRVVDPLSGRPVAGAMVMVWPGNGDVNAMPVRTSIGSASGSVQMVTDTEGRFVVRELPPGRFNVLASAVGYWQGLYGQFRRNGPARAVSLAAGEHATGLVVPVWKLATLSGRILDEAGDPIVGVGVRGFRRSSAEAWDSISSTLTDDRGEYRLANLVPGEYTVAVLPTQMTLPGSIVDDYAAAVASKTLGDFTAASTLRSTYGPAPSLTGARVDGFVTSLDSEIGHAATPPPPGGDGSLTTYPPTFFPGVPTIDDARIVSLALGEEHPGVDFALAPVGTGRVSGSVIGPDGPLAYVGVSLWPKSVTGFSFDLGLDAALTATDAHGAFTFLGVPAGAYTLRVVRPQTQAAVPESQFAVAPTVAASGSSTSFSGDVKFVGPRPSAHEEPTLWAAVPVTVTANETATVPVALHEGLRVSGRIEFSTTRPLPNPPPTVSTFLLPAQTGRFALPNTMSTGTQFATSGYPAGRYRLSVTVGGGFSVRSAMRDGHNLAEDLFDLTTDLDDVVITVTDQRAQVLGTVRRGTDAQADTPAEVVMFPADDLAWRADGGFERSTRFRAVGVRPTGEFAITYVPGGEYFVAAVDERTMGDFLDAGFLERTLTVATRMSVAEGETKTVALPIVQVPK